MMLRYIDGSLEQDSRQRDSTQSGNERMSALYVGTRYALRVEMHKGRNADVPFPHEPVGKYRYNGNNKENDRAGPVCRSSISFVRKDQPSVVPPITRCALRLMTQGCTNVHFMTK